VSGFTKVDAGCQRYNYLTAAMNYLTAVVG